MTRERGVPRRTRLRSLREIRPEEGWVDLGQEKRRERQLDRCRAEIDREYDTRRVQVDTRTEGGAA